MCFDSRSWLSKHEFPETARPQQPDIRNLTASALEAQDSQKAHEPITKTTRSPEQLQILGGGVPLLRCFRYLRGLGAGQLVPVLLGPESLGPRASRVDSVFGLFGLARLEFGVLGLRG